MAEYAAGIAASASASADLASQGSNPYASSDTSAAPPSIGGMVVGAHKHVPEGKVVEKSNIVGGGKKTFVETIADSTGKVVSPEQLVKHGLGEPKYVEKLTKELQKIAGDKGWKLDVYETPEGRQYQAVIGDDDDEEEASASFEGPPKGADKGAEGEADADEGGDVDEEEGSTETYWEKDEL